MKHVLILIMLLITPVVAQQSDPFPAIDNGVFYEYIYTPSAVNNTGTVSICALRYWHFRIEIFNVTKTESEIIFSYNCSHKEFLDGNLAHTGWAVFNVRVPLDRDDINGWWVNVLKGREAVEKVARGFARAIYADKIIINETTYTFNGKERKGYYAYFENTTTHSYGLLIFDKEYGFLYQRAIVINETSVGTYRIAQLDLFGNLILKKTNLFLRKMLPIIVPTIVIAVVIATVVIIRKRKTGKVAQF